MSRTRPKPARRLFAHRKPATCAHPYPQPIPRHARAPRDARRQRQCRVLLDPEAARPSRAEEPGAASGMRVVRQNCLATEGCNVMCEGRRGAGHGLLRGRPKPADVSYREKRELRRQAHGRQLVPRTRSSHSIAAKFGCELRVQSGTRIIELRVSFDSEVRIRACRKVERTSESGHSPLVAVCAR